MSRSDQPSTEGGVLDPPLLRAGSRFGGRYRLEHRLGHGGMAAVWLATDERLGRRVAVKVLSDTIADDDEYLRRFRREATLAAGLQHPNLVRVYDFDAGRRPYLVMEYVDGGTLAERIEAGEEVPVARLARELLSALRHIHAAGVLHRDVKPQNVLLDATDHARLTDFGIAQPRGATSLTAAGRVIGTESYLAPEVLAGRPASERSDLYALGMLLADTARDSGSASPVWSLIDRLRERDPDRRPATAAIALAELEQAERRPPAGEPTRALDAAPVPPPPPPRLRERTPVHPPPEAVPPASESERRRRRWLAGGALACVVAALLATLVLGVGAGDDGGPAAGGVDVPERNADANGGGEEATPAVEPDSPEPKPAGSRGVEAAAGSADGASLNDEGKALIDSGRPEEAIPILERAVKALKGSGDELTYNFALFNLGNALRLAGRPEEAIPLLEERLSYPNQVEAVAAELAAAQEAAGIAPEEKPPKPPKSEKGDDGPPYGNANGQDD